MIVVYMELKSRVLYSISSNLAVKNSSPIHWDMITDMRNGGEILADGKVIYRDGSFILE